MKKLGVDMEKETLEALKKTGQALYDLVEAWGKLVEAYKNPFVETALNIDYPFSESFDELYFKVLNWNFSAGEEIDVVLGVEEISEHLDRLWMSDECKAEITRRLKEEFETGF